MATIDPSDDADVRDLPTGAGHKRAIANNEVEGHDDSVIERPRADPLLGFYGPDSMMWKINREAVLLGAGPAALLLQIAHPSVAAGVAEHSTFEQDPIARLRGTLITTMDLIFGDGHRSEAAVRRLNSVHAGVRGESYRALDPELLLWVQVTLIKSSVEAYSRWVGRLSAGEIEQFWQEARIGRHAPGHPADFEPGRLAGTDLRTGSGCCPTTGRSTPRIRRGGYRPMILRPPLPLLPGRGR